MDANFAFLILTLYIARSFSPHDQHLWCEIALCRVGTCIGRWSI